MPQSQMLNKSLNGYIRFYSGENWNPDTKHYAPTSHNPE